MKHWHVITHIMCINRLHFDVLFIFNFHFLIQFRPPAGPKLARQAGLRPPAGRRPAGGLRARRGVQKHKVL